MNRIKYFIDYYRKMQWHMMPEDLLEMCAEDCSDEWNDFGWRTLMSARSYLAKQHCVSIDNI